MLHGDDFNAGLPVETHTVEAGGGVLLTLHRIPAPGASPVFLQVHNWHYSVLTFPVQHGLLSSSADWVVTGPETGLAFRLARAGYSLSPVLCPLYSSLQLRRLARQLPGQHLQVQCRLCDWIVFRPAVAATPSPTCRPTSTGTSAGTRWRGRAALCTGVTELLCWTGKLYCEDCYGRYLAPNCNKCGRKIIGVSCNNSRDSGLRSGQAGLAALWPAAAGVNSKHCRDILLLAKPPILRLRLQGIF